MPVRRTKSVTFGVALYFVVSCFALSALAAPPCTKEEAQAAEGAVSTIRSWETLYQQFQRYSTCDDGAIAEGFSDAVTSLLVDHWQDIELFNTQAGQTPPFRVFVIRHIDDSVPVERLADIVRNATDHCPSDLTNLCHDIEKAARKSSQGAE